MIRTVIRRATIITAATALAGAAFAGAAAADTDGANVGSGGTGTGGGAQAQCLIPISANLGVGALLGIGSADENVTSQCNAFGGEGKGGDVDNKLDIKKHVEDHAKKH